MVPGRGDPYCSNSKWTGMISLNSGRGSVACYQYQSSLQFFWLEMVAGSVAIHVQDTGYAVTVLVSIVQYRSPVPRDAASSHKGIDPSRRKRNTVLSVFRRCILELYETRRQNRKSPAPARTRTALLMILITGRYVWHPSCAAFRSRTHI